jgi:hypothetical protein
VGCSGFGNAGGGPSDLLPERCYAAHASVACSWIRSSLAGTASGSTSMQIGIERRDPSRN